MADEFEFVRAYLHSYENAEPLPTLRWMEGYVRNLVEQLEAMRVALDFFVNQPELVEAEDYLKARERFFNEGRPISSLDDRNPASSVGVPWNEQGYAGSNPAKRPT